MDTVALTTFLKICSLKSTNAKINQISRLVNGAGGYDYYKSLKAMAPKLALGNLTTDDIPSEVGHLSRKHERDDNGNAALTFAKWWAGQKLSPSFVTPPSTKFKPKGCNFSIRLKPEIAFEAEGQRVVLQFWCVAQPKLDAAIAGLGIFLMREKLKKGDFSTAQFKMLDVRSGKLFDEKSIPNNGGVILSADVAQFNSIWQQVQL